MSGGTLTQQHHRAKVEDALLRWCWRYTDAEIGRRLGLTPRRVAKWRWKLHLRRTDARGWYTTGQAARLTGYSPQYLGKLAARGSVRAHRLPASHGHRCGWWLLHPDDVERLSRTRRPDIWRAL